MPENNPEAYASAPSPEQMRAFTPDAHLVFRSLPREQQFAMLSHYTGTSNLNSLAYAANMARNDPHLANAVLQQHASGDPSTMQMLDNSIGGNARVPSSQSANTPANAAPAGDAGGAAQDARGNDRYRMAASQYTGPVSTPSPVPAPAATPAVGAPQATPPVGAPAQTDPTLQLMLNGTGHTTQSSAAQPQPQPQPQTQAQEPQGRVSVATPQFPGYEQGGSGHVNARSRGYAPDATSSASAPRERGEDEEGFDLISALLLGGAGAAAAGGANEVRRGIVNARSRGVGAPQQPSAGSQVGAQPPGTRTFPEPQHPNAGARTNVENDIAAAVDEQDLRAGDGGIRVETRMSDIPQAPEYTQLGRYAIVGPDLTITDTATNQLVPDEQAQEMLRALARYLREGDADALLRMWGDPGMTLEGLLGSTPELEMELRNLFESGSPRGYPRLEEGRAKPVTEADLHRLHSRGSSSLF